MIMVLADVVRDNIPYRWGFIGHQLTDCSTCIQLGFYKHILENERKRMCTLFKMVDPSFLLLLRCSFASML